ncbi:T9SS type A sorting domain-containing protein [bacterium]|nr:T9SS type A sorting domain-containing protein [bacterium]
MTPILVLAFLALLYAWNPGSAQGSKREMYPNSFAKDMQIDAPWFIKSRDTEIPVQFIIRDADVIDLEELEGLYIEAPHSGYGYDFTTTDTIFIKEYDPIIEDLDVAHWDTIVFIPLPGSYRPGQTLFLKATIDYEDGAPWSESFSKVLAVKIGNSELPKFDNWYMGDCHFHTSFTVNPYEFGGTYSMVYHCARAMGVDFVTATDHASDSCIILGVIIDDLNLSDWHVIPDSIAVYGNINPIIIRGEEADIQTYTEYRNHLLIYSANDFFSAPIPDGVAEKDHGDVYAFLVASPEAVAYAAHPYDPDYLWENDIVDSGIKLGALKGIQIWNERSVWDVNVDMDEYCDPFPFSDGEMMGEDNQWDEDLLDGLDHWDLFLWNAITGATTEPPDKIFIDGGSDAHGDFNYFSYHPFILGVPSPDVWATDNAFAKVRTLAYCPDTLGQQSIMDALRHGTTVATDGPIVVFHAFNESASPGKKVMIGQSDTVFSGGFDSLYITYKNTFDFGGVIERLLLKRVYLRAVYSDQVSLDSYVTGLEGSFTIPLELPIAEGWCCYRLEAYTFDEGEQYLDPDDCYRCFTNPIWFYVRHGSLFASNEKYDDRAKFHLDVFPNPFNLSCVVSTLEEAKVEIFDVLGEKIAELSKGEKLWKPGKNIRSGVYFIRAKTNVRQIIRKAVLIK